MAALSINERELEFFLEITNLMENHFPDMKEKFGIWRAHQHFEINHDELLHETSNPLTRESTLRIIKKTELPKNAFASTWKITEKGPVAVSWCCDDVRPSI